MKTKILENSIVKGILNYSISTWVNLFVGFASVILTTRLISPDVYGKISLFLSATSFVLYIFTFGLDAAYIRFYNEPPKDNTNSQLLYKILVVVNSIFISFSFLIISFYYKNVSYSLVGIENRLFVALFFLYVYSNIILRFLNIKYRMSFNSKMYNIQNILMNCASRIFIIISVFISNNIIDIIFILTLGIFLILIFYVYIQRKVFLPCDYTKHINLSLDFKNFRSLFKYAFFSAPTYIIVYANLYITQQIISTKMDPFALGIFSSVGFFSTILAALQGGFSTFWSAYVYKNYNEEKNRIMKMHNFVLLFSVLMLSLLVIFRDLVYIFIGEEFHDSKTFFSLLLLMPILSFIRETTAKGIEIANRNELSFIGHVISVIGNIVLCWILIPVWGLIGAAVANACSALFLYTFTTIYGQKFYSTIESNTKSILGIIVITSIVLVPFFEKSYLYILDILFIDSIMLYVFRKEVVYVLTLLRSNLK